MAGMRVVLEGGENDTELLITPLNFPQYRIGMSWPSFQSASCR